MRLSKQIRNYDAITRTDAMTFARWATDANELEDNYAIAVTEYHECNRKRIELKEKNEGLVDEIVALEKLEEQYRLTVCEDCWTVMGRVWRNDLERANENSQP